MGALLTTKQAAEQAGVHLDTMRRWIRDGIIEPRYVMRVGMRTFIDADGIPPEDERPKRGPKPKQS